MTHKILSLLSLSALLVIGGCNEVSKTEFVVSDDPCRSKLPVGGKDDILLLSGYEGTAISTVTVTDQSRDTEVARIFIEDRRKPLFIIASAYTDMIWSIEGHTERVSGFVARKSRGSKGAGAGVIGLPENKVDFMDYDCIPHFNDKKDKKIAQAKSRLKLAYGQPVDRVVTEYTLDSITLPSGTLTGDARRFDRENREKSSKKKRTKVAQGLSLSSLKNYKPAHETQLYRFYDDGIAYVDPKHVVSDSPLSDYEVYPDHAGLAQLIDSGHIQRRDSRTYYIRKTFQHFPAGLGGSHSVQFILGKGVKLPAGKPGHSGLLDEATGKCLTRRCR